MGNVLYWFNSVIYGYKTGQPNKYGHNFHFYLECFQKIQYRNINNKAIQSYCMGSFYGAAYFTTQWNLNSVRGLINLMCVLYQVKHDNIYKRTTF